MSHTLLIVPRAERDLKKIKKKNPAAASAVAGAIRALVEVPRPSGSSAVKNTPGNLRIRVGRFRVIYQVDDDERTVVIKGVRIRDESTYRKT